MACFSEGVSIPIRSDSMACFISMLSKSQERNDISIATDEQSFGRNLPAGPVRVLEHGLSKCILHNLEHLCMLDLLKPGAVHRDEMNPVCAQGEEVHPFWWRVRRGAGPLGHGGLKDGRLAVVKV